MLVIIRRHYPGFNDLLNSIPDHRTRSSYEVAEIVMAGLAMFIFKRGSRNNTDCSVSGNFEDNFITLFGLRLPIMDTVDDFLRKLPPGALEDLKKILVQRLLEKKVLNKWRYKGRYVISVDGTGLFSFDHEPFPGCPYKVSKTGKTSWQAHVVEAKLLCPNGLSISIATEWLQNTENIDEKQDCEQKAFLRLAKKIKAAYPRLPVIVTADALYPNNTIFSTCKKYGWNFIFTFKEGVLKTVWEEVSLLYPVQEKANRQERTLVKTKKGWLTEASMYINGIDYKGHTLNWIEYQSGHVGCGAEKRFVHITDIKVDRENAWSISEQGRMRWKIENEGFNMQKKGGYRLEHKYSRKCMVAMQNYYQLLQIAHLISQLTEKAQKVKQAIVQAGATLKSVIEDTVAALKKEVITEVEIEEMMQQTKQLRY